MILQEWFAVYVELNQQIAALLNAGDEEDLVELKGLQQQLSDVCYRQASQLEFRQNLLQAALDFHGVAQDVSKICMYSPKAQCYFIVSAAYMSKS